MSSRRRFEEQVILITGSSRNIGKATTLAFAREGGSLILNSRVSRVELEATAAECQALGSKVLPILADVSDYREVNRLAKLALDRFGKIDVLVSNVAIRPHKSILETTIEDWRHIMAVNLDATFYLCKALLPDMIKRKSGNIVVLGGVAGFRGLGGRPAVAASKGGLQGLVKGLAVDLGPYGIRVNLVIPGLVNTERRHPDWYPEWESERLDLGKETEEIPLRRLGTPEEIASLILFLASSDSSYISGQHIMCNGGWYT